MTATAWLTLSIIGQQHVTSQRHLEKTRYDRSCTIVLAIRTNFVDIAPGAGIGRDWKSLPGGAFDVRMLETSSCRAIVTSQKSFPRKTKLPPCLSICFSTWLASGAHFFLLRLPAANIFVLEHRATQLSLFGPNRPRKSRRGIQRQTQAGQQCSSPPRVVYCITKALMLALTSRSNFMHWDRLIIPSSRRRRIYYINLSPSFLSETFIVISADSPSVDRVVGGSSSLLAPMLQDKSLYGSTLSSRSILWSRFLSFGDTGLPIILSFYL